MGQELTCASRPSIQVDFDMLRRICLNNQPGVEVFFQQPRWTVRFSFRGLYSMDIGGGGGERFWCIKKLLCRYSTDHNTQCKDGRQ